MVRYVSLDDMAVMLSNAPRSLALHASDAKGVYTITTHSPFIAPNRVSFQIADLTSGSHLVDDERVYTLAAMAASNPTLAVSYDTGRKSAYSFDVSPRMIPLLTWYDVHPYGPGDHAAHVTLKRHIQDALPAPVIGKLPVERGLKMVHDLTRKGFDVEYYLDPGLSALLFEGKAAFSLRLHAIARQQAAPFCDVTFTHQKMFDMSGNDVDLDEITRRCGLARVTREEMKSMLDHVQHSLVIDLLDLEWTIQ